MSRWWSCWRRGVQAQGDGTALRYPSSCLRNREDGLDRSHLMQSQPWTWQRVVGEPARAAHTRLDAFCPSIGASFAFLSTESYRDVIMRDASPAGDTGASAAPLAVALNRGP